VARDDMAQVTVAVVDDHPVIHAGVRDWVAQHEAPVRIVQTAVSIDEVLAGPGRDADVLVVDLDFRDSDGGNALDRLEELCAGDRRIVIFSHDTEAQHIMRAQEAGVRAYLDKADAGANFIETILDVAADRVVVPRIVAGAMLADARPDRPQLSEQERTALRWWFQGMSKQSVAVRMGLSVHTVNQYICRARLKYVKAGRPSPTKAALLARAIEDGLIRPDEIGEYRSFAAPNEPDC
jgi:two-component system, NarL family, nitrate/nitrite response regulator NarL